MSRGEVVSSKGIIKALSAGLEQLLFFNAEGACSPGLVEPQPGMTPHSHSWPAEPPPPLGLL